MKAVGHLHTVEIRNLTVRLGGREVLSGIDADIRCGEVTAVIGPNGAGKTTLLKAILGLVPYTGTIRFCRAEEHGKGSPKVGYVPQRIDIDRTAPVTVLDLFVVSEARRPIFLGSGRTVRRAARESLARSGADNLIDRRLGALSGGELQRVMLALALRGEPDIVLLDEPVSGVDAAGEELFCDVLGQVHRESHFSLVLVSHDLSVVSRHADRVICLNRTVVCQGAGTEVLTPGTLAAMYGPGAQLAQHGSAPGHGHIHAGDAPRETPE